MELAYLNAERLYDLARAAYNRTCDAPDERTPEQYDALVSVLFAAATLEALFMELAHLLTGTGGGIVQQPKHLTDLATDLKSLEENRGSTQEKFLLLMRGINGEEIDRGAQPYQDFHVLFSVRDSIVHLKPEIFSEDRHRIVKLLEAKRILADEMSGRSCWIRRISTRAVARWACNVVVDVVDLIRGAARESNEHSLLNPEFWGAGYKYLPMRNG